MKKHIAVFAALAGALALGGCASSGTELSGSVDEVVDAAQSVKEGESATVEVTGYIVGPRWATSLGGDDEHHSALHIYGSDDETGPYVLALFPEQPDELNDAIADMGGVSDVERVTVSGELMENGIGAGYVNIENCEIVEGE